MKRAVLLALLLCACRRDQSLVPEAPPAPAPIFANTSGAASGADDAGIDATLPGASVPLVPPAPTIAP